MNTTRDPSVTGTHSKLWRRPSPALVLAMVLLGGAPAALIGVGTIAVGHMRFHERRDLFVNNLVAYSWFPLLGGILFHEATKAVTSAMCSITAKFTSTSNVRSDLSSRKSPCPYAIPCVGSFGATSIRVKERLLIEPQDTTGTFRSRNLHQGQRPPIYVPQ